MKKISYDDKLEIISISKKIGISKAAKLYGVSRISISNWIKKIKTEGENSLEQAKRVESNHPEKMDAKTEKEIIDLKKSNPKLSAQKIKDILNLQYSRAVISKKIKQSQEYIKFEKKQILNEKTPFTKLFLSIKTIDEKILKQYDESLPSYRIVIEDKVTGIFFSGLTYERTDLSISIFVDYIFSLLQKNDLINNESILYIYGKSGNQENSFLHELASKYSVKLQHNKKYRLAEGKKVLEEQWIQSNKDKNKIQSQVEIFLGDIYSYKIIKNYEAIYKKYRKDDKCIILKEYADLFNTVIFNSFPIIVDKYIRSIYNKKNKDQYWDNVFIENSKKLDSVILSIKNIAFNEKKSFKLKRSIDLYDKILFSLDYTENISLKIDILKERANTILQIGNWKEAEKDLQKAFSLSKKIKDKENLAIISKLFGSVYLQSNDYKRSLAYHKKFIAYSKETKNTKQLSTGYANLGGLYFNLRKMNLALKYHNKSLELFDETDDLNLKLSSLAAIGTIYYLKEKYYKALKYLEESYSLAKKHNFKQIEMSSLGNLGFINFRLGKINKSEEICNILYQNSIEINNKLWMSSTLNNLVNINVVKRDFGKAIKYSIKFNENAEKLDNKAHIITGLVNYSEIYMELKKYDIALEYIDKAKDIAEKIENLPLYLEVILKKIIIYYHWNKFLDANNIVIENSSKFEEVKISSLLDEYKYIKLKLDLSLLLENKNYDRHEFENKFIDLYLFIDKESRKRDKIFTDYEKLIRDYFDLYKILLKSSETSDTRIKYLQEIGNKLLKYLRINEEITGVDADDGIVGLVIGRG